MRPGLKIQVAQTMSLKRCRVYLSSYVLCSRDLATARLSLELAIQEVRLYANVIGSSAATAFPGSFKSHVVSSALRCSFQCADRIKSFSRGCPCCKRRLYAHNLRIQFHAELCGAMERVPSPRQVRQFLPAGSANLVTR